MAGPRAQHASPGHPRLYIVNAAKAWITGPRSVSRSPLARGTLRPGDDENYEPSARTRR